MPTLPMESAPADVTFQSILLPPGQTALGDAADTEVLHDLALDQVLDRLAGTAPAAAAAFRTPCADVEQVRYRQEVFRALEAPELRHAVDAFLDSVRLADGCDVAAAGRGGRYERELWHLRGVRYYVGAVVALADALDGSLGADAVPGLRGLRDHLAAYRRSAEFTALVDEAAACAQALDEVRYNLLIRGAKITVAAVDDEPDLREEVLDTFARFRTTRLHDADAAMLGAGMDHVQGWILEQVGQVHRETFERIVRFFAQTGRYRDDVVQRFAGEVRFYLACLDHLAPLRAAGLPVCYPEVSDQDRTLDVRGTYDLALATRLTGTGTPVVLNDLRLSGDERLIVISGPNQGGKSTTARCFGQLHHLAAIGCPVPGRSARVFLCDRVLTAFEREEQLDDLQGRLGAEVDRMRDLAGRLTPRSVVVLNEVFSSTALADARLLTRDMLQRVLDAGASGVCVTFIDELSRMDPRCVSMVSEVDPDDAARRTFVVSRRVADGRAYARALAHKHGLTAQQVQDRMTVKEDAR